MTILEFEAWVSEHYEGLVALAEQQTKSYRSSYNAELAHDLLHQLVESLLETPEQIASLQEPRLMGWFNRALWRDAVNAQRDATVKRGHAARLEADAEVLGEDIYTDARAVSGRRRDFNATARKQATQPGASPLMGVQWDGPMPGSIRWRYQQLRDNRLFDERAIRSLADSMHRASARYRHHGEHGFSFTEFGQEVAR